LYITKSIYNAQIGKKDHTSTEIHYLCEII
jgi:hypothetical protein